MKIIGHRGAAGLALENSLASLRAGVAAGADALEIDVRLTSDGHLVLSHDPNTGRLADQKLVIRTSSLAELKKLHLINGEPLLTLIEALQAVPRSAIVIEGKDDGWAGPLANQLSTFKNRDITVISFEFSELKRFHELMPALPTFLLEHTKPFSAIKRTANAGFSGVDIGFWLLNPFTYRAARLRRLKIIVYTVNKPWLAAIFKRLFPDIGLTTNYPNKMQRWR